MDRAPDPEDVLWRTCSFPTGSGVRSDGHVIILLLLHGTAILMDEHRDFKQLDHRVVEQNFFVSFGLWLAQTLLIVLGHIVVIISTIVLATR